MRPQPLDVLRANSARRSDLPPAERGGWAQVKTPRQVEAQPHEKLDSRPLGSDLYAILATFRVEVGLARDENESRRTIGIGMPHEPSVGAAPRAVRDGVCVPRGAADLCDGGFSTSTDTGFGNSATALRGDCRNIASLFGGGGGSGAHLCLTHAKCG